MAVVLGARATLSVSRALLSVRAGRWRKRVGGSCPGRRPNRPRDFDLGAHAILRDYFGVDGVPPVYGEDAFEERFRLPRPVFNRLFRAICIEPMWRRTVNATGRPQAHAIQKLSAALRVLGYEEPFDHADEYCRLSRSTIDMYTRRLTHFIIDKWEPTYLRRPNAEELEHILTRNAARGMPGCMGSIDCTHWTWAKFPKALAGQYKDRNGKLSVVSETVCDEDLYIWNLFVGCPGAYNDKKVLAASPLMLDVNDGTWPPRIYNYTLNGPRSSIAFLRGRPRLPPIRYLCSALLQARHASTTGVQQGLSRIYLRGLYPGIISLIIRNMGFDDIFGSEYAFLSERIIILQTAQAATYIVFCGDLLYSSVSDRHGVSHVWRRFSARSRLRRRRNASGEW